MYHLLDDGKHASSVIEVESSLLEAIWEGGLEGGGRRAQLRTCGFTGAGSLDCVERRLVSCVFFPGGLLASSWAPRPPKGSLWGSFWALFGTFFGRWWY